VVEEPARRYGVEVEPALVDALMVDAPKADALPLLAFALQRLWSQYGNSGTLTKEHYDRFGGLTGLIEDAAERALRGVAPEDQTTVPSTPPPRQVLDLTASTFVPALAQLNDQGATIRRIANWNSFNDEQQKLLQQFDRWRLIVRRGEAGATTVEVAHEALFRAWERFKSWLDAERARLETLRLLEAAAATWDRQGRPAAFLDHRGTRLEDANELEKYSHYSRRLGDVDKLYLAACRKSEQLATRKTRWVRGSIYTLLISIIAGLVAWINQAYIKKQWNWYATLRPYRVANFDQSVLSADAEHVLRPGQSFKECAKNCPEMIVVPAGEFMMGSPTTEQYRDSESEDDGNGRPLKVTIPKPIAIAKTDVTFADWDACVSVGACSKDAGNDSGWGRDKQPAIFVSWDDAKAYVTWLSMMTGKTYRLLTEAEWEYAARAGTTTAYYWGDEIGKENANCVGCGSQWDGRQTSPVGSFKPNAFGLYDMAGNVWQWVEDCWHVTYRGAPTDSSAWTSGDCSIRGVRGGSWNYDAGYVRSASRSWNSVPGRGNLVGFRVARTLNQ
jgi:formylglycine-generating enzyme required for sulfatase activity